MFIKLKLQLTAINLFLLSLVLGIAFLSMRLFIKAGLERQSIHMINITAREGRYRGMPLSPRDRLFQSSIFFVKTDQKGVIARVSPNAPYTREFTERLLRQTKLAKLDRGLIRFHGSNLRFFRSKKPYGFIYVFFDTRPEQGVLSWFTAATLFIGGTSMILIALVSYFLASRALVPVKEAWEKQRNFVADASHELRTPLAIIQTNLELVMGNSEETVESQRRWLENIVFEYRMMSKLVEDLLFLARTDLDEKAAPMGVFSLSDALEEAVLPFEPVMTGKGIAFQWRIQPAVEIMGHEDRIKQLVAILLDNAIKHTPPAGSISLSLSAGEKHTLLTVVDTGEGIPREQLGHIFQRFYRVESSRHHRHGGAGLGLSIAERIVHDHKGTIQASSIHGKGSTFKVVLPKTGL